jgi:Flp pilus assembly CpaE family ATPase
VLFGITDIEQAAAEELRGKQGRLFMTSLLDLARRMYDFVIVDMGSNTQIGTHYGALTAADVVIFVNSSDRTSLVPNRDTLNALIKRADLQRDRFRLVLNRYDDRDRLSPKDIADYLEMPIAAVVPEDTSREMIASVNAGKPFAMTHMGKNNEAAEKTLRGLLDIAEEVFPPMGRIIAERGGRNGRRSGGWFRKN